MDFFDYFKDGLKWLLVRKDSWISLIFKGIAKTFDTVMADIRLTRDQFFAARASDLSLEDIAKDRGLVQFITESTAVFLQRVRDAYAFLSSFGTVASLNNILTLMGFDNIVITEFKGNEWAEFEVEIEEQPGAQTADLVSVIESAKPAKSRLKRVVVWLDPPFGFSTDAQAEGFSKFMAKGTTTSTSTDQAVDTGATFITDNVTAGMTLHNNEDGKSSNINNVPGETVLDLDNDIIITGQNYYINKNVGGGLARQERGA